MFTITDETRLFGADSFL
jgi:molecular chaperone DnaK (HSP70)